MISWSQLSLQARVRRLRYILPPLLVVLVVLYQLGVASYLEQAYGHAVHYSFEIAFYSMAGPVATWLTLAWVERQLAEKESLEQEIHARNRHLASLTNASADAILSLNSTGHIESWNRGAERLFGYSARDMVGQPLTALLADADRLLERLQHEGVIKNFETTVDTQEGRTVPVDLTHTLLAEHPSRNLTSSLILRDITLRHERETIVKEERGRIARDLHDGVAQILYLLALKADMAAGQVDANPAQAQAELKEIGRQSRQVIREIRRTIFALHPLEWSNEGFLPALEQFVADFATQLNWEAAFAADDHPPISERLQPTVFRLVQESLNNVAKHADASQVWITIRVKDHELALSVRDDGCGFEPAVRSRSGLGLGQMRRRVAAVGGRFRINSQTGEGTTVTAEIPL